MYFLTPTVLHVHSPSDRIPGYGPLNLTFPNPENCCATCGLKTNDNEVILEYGGGGV